MTSGTPTPSLITLLHQSFAAFCLGCLVFAFWYPGQEGLDLPLMFLFTVATNFPVLVLAMVAVALFVRFTGRPRPMLALLLGLGVPLSGMAGAFWFYQSDHSKAMLEMGAPALLAFGLLGLFWRPQRRIPASVTVGISVAALVALGLLVMGVGRQEVPGLSGDMVARAALPQEAPLAEAMDSPNVVLISIDTLRADAVLQEGVPTPALDALRAKSLWAPYGHAATPSTLPSHITMMTGESPMKHGTYTNLGILTPEPDTLAAVFAEAGYRTAGTAANGLLSRQHGFARGFESLINVATGDEGSAALKRLAASSRRHTWFSAFASDRLCMQFSATIVDRRWILKEEWKDLGALAFAPQVEIVAAEHLRQLQEGQRPYFYFLHFMAPHAPYEALPPFRGQLSENLPVPNYLQDVHLGSNEVTYLIGRYLKEGHPQNQMALDLARARYHEELMMVDDVLGRLLAQIESDSRPTIILFTSDHGEAFGELRKMRHGNNLYAPAIRVPFMISGLGLSPAAFRSFRALPTSP